jgi:alkyl hydroperoxide reductase subunit AhpC
VRVTHRFHPLFGQGFEFVAHRQNWREDRVHLHDENGVLFSLPAGWTDVVPRQFLSWSSRMAAARSLPLGCWRWRT